MLFFSTPKTHRPNSERTRVACQQHFAEQLLVFSSRSLFKRASNDQIVSTFRDDI